MFKGPEGKFCDFYLFIYLFLKCVPPCVNVISSSSGHKPTTPNLRLPPLAIVSLVHCVPSDRANVSLTRLLMPSSSDVVAVSTVPPSVSRSSFSSCVNAN